MRAVEGVCPACREAPAGGRHHANGKIRQVSTGGQSNALAKLERHPSHRLLVALEPAANT